MPAIAKKDKSAVKINTTSKSARIVKNTVMSSGTDSRNAGIAQARRQAKKIMQGLHEAEQIRSGKLKATSFEEHFGKV